MKKTDRLGKALYIAFSCIFGFVLTMTKKIVISNGIFSTNEEAQFLPFSFMDIPKWVIYTLLTLLGMVLVQRFVDSTEKHHTYTARKSRPWLYFAFVAVLMLCWLPCLLTYFPGGIYSDTFESLHMAHGLMPWYNHHPIPYTMLWKWVFQLGDALHMDEYHSFFLFTALQTAAMAAAGGYFLYCLYKKGFSYIFIGISTAFFGLFNLIPLYLVSLWKDTPFSVAVLLFSTFIFDVFWNEDSEKRFCRPWMIAIYCILAYLVSFLRNNGFYAFIVFSIIFVAHFAIKRARKMLIYSVAVSASLICLFGIIRGPIYNSLNYNVHDSVESVGIPVQQVAYVIENGGNVLDEDLTVVQNVIPLDVLHSTYRPLIMDPVKWSGAFNVDYLSNNMGTFLNSYLRIALHNPVKAFKGMALANEGFWDLTRQTHDAYVNNWMWPGEGDQYAMRDLIQEWFGFSLKNDYSTKYLYSSALFAWFILASTIIGFRRRRGGSYLPLAYVMGLWFSILIATPIAFSLRYLFPMVLLIPMSCAGMIAPCYQLQHPKDQR